MNNFAAVMPVAGELSLEEPEDDLEILRRRVAGQRRAAFLGEMEAGRQEFARGNLKPISLEEIMGRSGKSSAAEVGRT